MLDMKNKYIAYIRVSTQKQSTHGVSLVEQRHAIEQYAARNQFTVVAWYEEVTTAAKGGRPVFKSVMKKLVAHKGDVGLIMHKIDRGARNLRDWADIGEAIDLGITVCFTHDNLDLHTRGGRLTADIQAVIAADYIRNLRDEVKKGIEGRLRQGIYPFAAPCGYLNRGGGKAKVPSPAVAPFIIYAFKCYANGKHSLRELAAHLMASGFDRADKKPIGPGQLSTILRNPFYYGVMQVKGKMYQGIHQPLISSLLFEEVQQVLQERRPQKKHKHVFRYRNTLRCCGCSKMLLGENQKGRVTFIWVSNFLLPQA